MTRLRFWVLLCLLVAPVLWANPLDPAREAMAEQRYVEADALLTRHLEANPEDEEAARLQAMSWAQAGDLPRAQVRLSALAKVTENADVLLSYAQVQHWRGQDQGALATLARAQTLAPDYGDLYRLELQILARAHASADQRRDYALRYQALYEQHAAAIADLPETLAPVRGQGWLEAGLFGSYLTGDLDHSFGQYLSGAWTQVNGRTWYGTLEQGRRFGLDDTELSGGVYQPVRGSHQLHLNASVSPTRKVRPEYSLYAGWYFSPREHWGLEPGIRITAYDQGHAQVASLLIERYWQAWRFAYTPAWVRLDSDNAASSHQFHLMRSYRQYSHVGLGFATGRDLERTPSAVLVTRVNSISLDGMHYFTPRLALTYRLGANQLVDRYDRYDWRIGVRYRY